jgi:hypothetical protein
MERREIEWPAERLLGIDRELDLDNEGVSHGSVLLDRDDGIGASLERDGLRELRVREHRARVRGQLHPEERHE